MSEENKQINEWITGEVSDILKIEGGIEKVTKMPSSLIIKTANGNRYGLRFSKEHGTVTLDELPRRIIQNMWTPVEQTIYDAMQMVEKMPADERLTEAVILLSKAKQKVADYIDSKKE